MSLIASDQSISNDCCDVFHDCSDILSLSESDINCSSSDYTYDSDEWSLSDYDSDDDDDDDQVSVQEEYHNDFDYHHEYFEDSPNDFDVGYTSSSSLQEPNLQSSNKYDIIKSIIVCIVIYFACIGALYQANPELLKIRPLMLNLNSLAFVVIIGYVFKFIKDKKKVDALPIVSILYCFSFCIIIIMFG